MVRKREDGRSGGKKEEGREEKKGEYEEETMRQRAGGRVKRENLNFC